MSRLSQIPIRVEGAEARAGATIGGGVQAILMEIASALDRLASGGEPSAIDLRSLPMSDADRAQLIEALGPGEVRITLETEGLSSIRETNIHGVWWTEYHDRDGQLLAGFIEVARVPSILVVDTDELQQGAARLRGSLAVPRAN